MVVQIGGELNRAKYDSSVPLVTQFFKTGGYHLGNIQSTLDNSNLQGKLKKVRVIGSSSYRG